MADAQGQEFLTGHQLARVQALKHARSVLGNTTIAGRSGVETTDLVAVAGWIIDGRDPYAAPRYKFNTEEADDAG